MISLRNRHLFLLDLLLLPATAVLAFILRLDTGQLQNYYWHLLIFLAIAVPVKLLVFYRLGLYGRFWRYASVDELFLIVTCSAVSLLVVVAIIFGVAVPMGTIQGFPRSIPFIDGLLTMLVIGGPRFAVRRFHRVWRASNNQNESREEKRVLVVGAGDAGAMIVKEMKNNPNLGLVPVGFIDDDKSKHGILIHGVSIVGGRDQLPALVEGSEIDEVIIAMPSASGTVVREIMRICVAAGIPARTVPSLVEIVSGEVQVNQIREIKIEDLLRREPVHIDSSGVERMLRGSRILVTGAGGSIGSELCRQVARCRPDTLVLMGHGENSIFDISNELKRTYPALKIAPTIADLRDRDRLLHILGEHKPEVVFHAAAHKHVPLMEQNAAEAVTNNVVGTDNILRLCEELHVERFVLISTDKAVNPTNVMGATKRVAEFLVQESARRCGRPYVSVRFGNVLGSRGSVIPTFTSQILSGGPVTITDPEVKRYFMTIPEAVQLVLQAATFGGGGEVILLDMGEPIKIADLAKDLIELSGYEVGRDIKIVYTGLRPGEKLFEELFVEGEEYEPTQHEKLFIIKNHKTSPKYSMDRTIVVEELVSIAKNGDPAKIKKKLREIVPNYSPAGESREQ